MTALATQSDFARQAGVHRSTVTRWKQDGRLVLTDAGLIDVDASLERIRSTEGAAPMNYARREALAEARAAALAPEPPPAPAAAPPEPRSDTLEGLMGGDVLSRLGLKTKYEALRKLQAEADRAQMQRDLERGDLVERKAVRKDLTDAVAVILNAAETLPDRLAPILTGVAEQSTVRAILRDEVEQFLAQVSERLGQVAGQ
jgi:hypothetical protein